MREMKEQQRAAAAATALSGKRARQEGSPPDGQGGGGDKVEWWILSQGLGESETFYRGTRGGKCGYCGVKGCRSGSQCGTLPGYPPKALQAEGQMYDLQYKKGKAIQELYNGFKP